MIRCKNLTLNDQIGCLSEWFMKCPPMGKVKHWKDGRSAKETAKHWVYLIPQPFKDILKPLNLKYTTCSPEYISTFDGYGGNGRNHDLLILAKNENQESVVISVESKVDESFGDAISKTIQNAEKRKKEKPNSKGLNRITDLRIALFGKEDDSQLNLMYQFLTAVAGTVAEAKKLKAKSAVFLIQTFISDEIDIKKHSQNQNDLNSFVTLFSKSEYSGIQNNELLGPFKIISKTEYLQDDIDIYIGKFEVEI